MIVAGSNVQWVIEIGGIRERQCVFGYGSPSLTALLMQSVSFNVPSHPISSHPVLSRLVPSCPVLSRLFSSCPVSSRPVPSHPVHTRFGSASFHGMQSYWESSDTVVSGETMSSADSVGLRREFVHAKL